MAKTKALTSCAVTAKLICVFVFAYAKSRFSHDEAHIYYVKLKQLLCMGQPIHTGFYGADHPTKFSIQITEFSDAAAVLARRETSVKRRTFLIIRGIQNQFQAIA